MSPKRRPSRPAPEADSPAPAAADRGERLQKVLAAAGLGSRRDCEELITEGRVEVDGQVVTELGVRVDPHAQEIKVDGSRLAAPKRRYYLVNKPVGVVCTNFDPSGRTRVVDLVETDERLFSIGRLDRSSEGMILLTNDGEFANRIAHPRYGVTKTYRVVVAGQPRPEDLQKLVKGVYLAEGVARATAVYVKKKLRESTELEIVLNEGKNREIRRVLARIGHKVLRLKRTAIGDLKLGELPTGAARRLTPQEVRSLHQQTQPGARPKRRPQGAAGGEQTGGRTGGRSPAKAAPPSRGTDPAKRQGTVLDFDAPSAGQRRSGSGQRPRPSGGGGKGKAGNKAANKAGNKAANKAGKGKRPARGSQSRRSGDLPE